MERLINSIGGFFMRRKNLQPLLEAAIMAALALILDLLPSIKLSPFISISFAMVPVFILSFRWGLRYGLLSGFLWGLLQLVIGDVYILHWFQFIIEYFIAFSFVGFAGIVMKYVQQSFQVGNKVAGMTWVVVGIFISSLARYIIHYIAGVVFWGSYAPEGQPAWLYSLIVNGSAWIGNFLFSSVVLIILLAVSTRILTENRKQLDK